MSVWTEVRVRDLRIRLDGAKQPAEAAGDAAARLGSTVKASMLVALDPLRSVNRSPPCAVGVKARPQLPYRHRKRSRSNSIRAAHREKIEAGQLLPYVFLFRILQGGNTPGHWCRWPPPIVSHTLLVEMLAFLNR